MQVQRRQLRALAGPGAGDRTAARGAVPDAAGGADAADAPAPEIEAAVGPMLEAVVRMAGAAAGAVRIVATDGIHLDPGVAVGLPANLARTGAGAIDYWCDRCTAPDRSDAACANARRYAARVRLSTELSGPVCRHVVAVPLRFEGEAIGTLDLLYETAADLPARTMPLLDATGELIGVAIANARHTRENLRASLMRERQSMANEVHDSLAQGLTYMRMRMSLLRDAVLAGDGPAAVKYSGDVDEALTHSHRRLRELITYFRSRMDPRGLRWALAEAAESFPDRTGIALSFDSAVSDPQLPVEREIEIFHIVQEALANVSRHANAGHVRMTLDRIAGGYEITVEDDGIGIPDGAVREDLADTGHFGIAIMSERARRLGGELAIESAEGSGARVRLRFPAAQPPTGDQT